MHQARLVGFVFLLTNLFSLTGLSQAKVVRSTNFVKIEQGQFHLDGKEFFFVGSNFYRLALSDRFSGDDNVKQEGNGTVSFPWVDDVFAGYAANGIRVVRIWGFSCEGSRGHDAEPALLTLDGLKRTPIELNEPGFTKLDYVLAVAARHNIKIILPLVNFEHEYCGMEWWVENTVGSKDKQLFYSDPRVWEKFSSYVSTVLERKNTITKVAYKDDPTIFSFELANEPHTEDYYECKKEGFTVEECKELRVGYLGAGTLVYNWLVKASRFVKQIDPNHLLSSGDEGYFALPEDTAEECREKHQWINNGIKGTDYVQNASIPTIDFLTTHFYPDNWYIPVSDGEWVKHCLFEERAAVAKKFNKPIILEETGFNERLVAGSQQDYPKDRAYHLSRMFRMATEAGFSGTMVWQVVPLLRNDEPADEDDFTFPFQLKDKGKYLRTPESYAVSFQTQCMSEFAPKGEFASCVSICPKGTTVDVTRYGLDSDGRRCYLPEPLGVSERPFPICLEKFPWGGNWGWSKSEALCMAYKKSALQFPKEGGCSCVIP